MRKLLLYIAALGIMACDNNKNNAASQALDDLDDYVDSVKKANRDYEKETYWTGVQAEYDQIRQRVEANKKDLSEKQMEKYGKIEADFAELKKDYQTEYDK